MMGKVILSGVSKLMTKPTIGTPLSNIAEGSLVKILENGNSTEFYVAKHNYESALNGNGRTLLVRKLVLEIIQWHSSTVDVYATSDIDSYANGSYKNLINLSIRNLIGTTKFYYTPGNSNYTVTTLERGVFLLSASELGKTSDICKVEGSTLPIASTLEIAYYGDSTTTQWTRSPSTDNTQKVMYVNPYGVVADYPTTMTRGFRPCFTLPADSVFMKEDGTLVG